MPHEMKQLLPFRQQLLNNLFFYFPGLLDKGRFSSLSRGFVHYSLLPEVPVQQALKGLAVSRLVPGHLVGNWL